MRSANGGSGGKSIVVSPPEFGEQLIVLVETGDRLLFTFNPHDAAMSRQGTALVFDFYGGGRLVLADYFEGGEGGGAFPLLGVAGPDVFGSEFLQEPQSLQWSDQAGKGHDSAARGLPFMEGESLDDLLGPIPPHATSSLHADASSLAVHDQAFQDFLLLESIKGCFGG